jgi:hypothetical protein
LHILSFSFGWSSSLFWGFYIAIPEKLASERVSCVEFYVFRVGMYHYHCWMPMYHGTGTLGLNEYFFGRIGNNLVASWMILLLGIIKHNGQIQQMLVHVVIVGGGPMMHCRIPCSSWTQILLYIIHSFPKEILLVLLLM